MGPGASPTLELEAIVAGVHALGQDRFDEVWEGNYHMAPAPHLWHAYLGGQLAVVLQSHVARARLHYTDPFNLGEPDNYRVPDAGLHRSLPNAAFVPTAAMVIEIVSPGDESWEKFDHFAAHGVDEVLIVDPVEATSSPSSCAEATPTNARTQASCCASVRRRSKNPSNGRATTDYRERYVRPCDAHDRTQPARSPAANLDQPATHSSGQRRGEVADVLLDGVLPGDGRRLTHSEADAVRHCPELLVSAGSWREDGQR